ncbi:hydroxymethylpyrimidine/phosphomethylpyrimidine kinase [Abditibacterium utsteinense]|uniref:hydroxymethylpyrimidine kinase n=1 Tax=Abditibacterium utsteinense TaxID=1960156 RepID=A0A2S8SUN4_9BACT|nr:hydroxymethylpyrimidine/phosphomethylpyrimidine kinase [Abditibacterium utsteinense]PQV64496.1 hydroxymethylpyrimidine/phosphomethylpyrimidine kinase [Abditibacterium utsteinense]
MPKFTPVLLCIGGLDPSGGAGITADARAASAFGAHALSVATAIVAQNTRGVAFVEPLAPTVLQGQIETLLADISPGAIKIGMIPNLAAVAVLEAILRPLHTSIPIVIDTVFAPTTGLAFNDEATIEAICRQLLPLAAVVTPNALEAQQLGAQGWNDKPSMERAALMILKRSGAQNVLLKGGHSTDTEFSTDIFCDGEMYLELRAPREKSFEVRGTGCLLAAALAAQLAAGATPSQAAQNAKNWLTQEFHKARMVGGGRRIAAI